MAYEVYDSYETDYDNLSCTNQNTNGKREVTLITCNNIKNKRRVVKATQKG
ncbi:MAG: sortase [Clostridia bacterium]|nr:sortase [Clostridia bacterium]